jgi:HEAT repeat protein
MGISLLRRALLALLVAASLLVAGVGAAQDVATAKRELAQSDDFRVRVSAALFLGRAHPPDAVDVLGEALADQNPAVRAAAAAALATVGDPAAVPLLERAAAHESQPAAKGAMDRATAALKATSVRNAKYVVQLGTMRNNTTVRGNQLGGVLRDAARARATAIPGVVVADGNEAARIARERSVPLLTLDGSLTRLTQGRSGGNVTFRAQVQFALRKDQTLKASMTGAATSYDTAGALANQARLISLQNDAVDGAVESAMRGADSGLAMAAQ